MMSWTTKSKVLALFAAGSFGLLLCGGETPPGPALSGSEIARNARMSQLEERRKKLLLKMHYTRIELIRKNARLRNLQQEIVRRSRELALELNTTKEMGKLNDELARLEAEMNGLVKDKKTNGDKK